MEKTFEQIASTNLKIVLIGPESTGKTTLARQLAKAFQTEWVPEYMRSYLQEKWDKSKTTCTREDLIPIAEGQLELENKYNKKAKRYLFCDTNLLELQVYSEYYFDGYCPPKIEQANAELNYDLYLLTYIDVPWEEDDLRDRPYDRSTLFCRFENELKKRELPYIVLKGSASSRLEQAKKAIGDYTKQLYANRIRS
ncbi:MAG: ATP-binding protein [Flavobacteriaceae bacterium]|nr:ATP-binding protein [Flavobacteriaceae bacterium]